MIEYVDTPTTEDDHSRIAVQYQPDLMQVSVGITGLDAVAILDPWAEAIGAQFQFALKEMGRVITDEAFDPANPEHDVEVTDVMIGQVFLNAVAEQVSVQEQQWFTHLERGSTNRLIRLLRKARDASFGRDE